MSMLHEWDGESVLDGRPLSQLGRAREANPYFSVLHGIASRMSARAPLTEVLAAVIECVIAVIRCDSCFVYILEGNELTLRASRNSHPDQVGRLKLKLGEGITGWVAEHRQPVVVARNAFRDTRFRRFNDLPEDHFEAFLSVPLLSRGRVIGVINLQNRESCDYSAKEVALVSTIGLLVGAEIEMARVEKEMSVLATRLEQRKVIERAKGILQSELTIGEQEAYSMLQRQSQERRRPMKDIAEAIVLSRAVRDAAS